MSAEILFSGKPGSPGGANQVRAWILGLLLLLTLIFTVMHLGELENFLMLVRNASPACLLLGLILQVATYVCAAAVWQQALRQAGQPLSLWSLVPLGVAKLFSDQALPSGGVSGAGLLISVLCRRGVPTERSLGILIQSMVGYYTAYLFIALASLLLLWLHHKITHWILIPLALFFAAMAALPFLVLCIHRISRYTLPALLQRWTKLLNLIEQIRSSRGDLLRMPWLIAKITMLQLCVFLLDALTLWVMLAAIGIQISFLAVLPSFVIASIVATISPIPLGLGTFEAGCVGMLTMFNISAEAALTATLLLRGFTVWLPMLPGLWVARRALR